MDLPRLRSQSMVCSLLGNIPEHTAIAFDLAGALGAGGALHLSLSEEGITGFIGAGFGGGGEIGVTVGPAFEASTSAYGFRTYAVAGGGAGLGVAGTIQAGSNGVLVSGGGGLVEGILAETGYGFGFGISNCE